MPRTRQLLALPAAAAALLLALPAAAAGSETQSVTGVIESSISASLSQPTVTRTLQVGGNTIEAGTLTVDANVLATVNVTFDKTAMTVWANGVYGTAALGAPLGLTATDLAGGAVGTATSSTGGSFTTSLLGQTTYSLVYNQLVATSDAPGTYRIQTTYTVSGGL